MSIQDELARLVAGGRLKLIEPLLPAAHQRVIYATPELHSELVGPWEEPRGERMGFLRRDLDRFSLGQHITVGQAEDKICDLKRLSPERDEIWEFRSRAPKPSIRIFGSFVEQDVLVLTNMKERKPLGHKRSRAWAIEISRCKTEWRKLFPHCEPHHGESIHDYIKANVSAVGDFEGR